VDVLYCLIEPEAHSVIYRCVQESVTKPYARPLASALRYVIVKGIPPELCVILSVSGIDGKLIRAVNTLSKTITRGSADVTGVWLHQDSTRGTFYLGTTNPRAHSTSLKVFGKGELYQKFGGKSFLYPVFSFSQVNASIVDRMIASAWELLKIDNTTAFYDLYCGYGVFTLTIGDAARESVGVERSPESIQAAIANAKRQGAHAVRFQRSDITETSIGASVSRMRPGDCLLLDPPRGGTSPGVIEHLARIRPARVVHIFCDIDGMSTEVKRWRMSGYRVVRGIPFDMFPGTDETELMVLLEPR
jgi:tRNA/tmRNA/rRNA uracil-C5-methylase (TrmA/RlmC/RlmD family)